ncbi:BadF/BadG/BcrA/BcrD ATPase family protein [Litorisediminicola beolgyonensis]|uniref:BadF/BadG/BcrA/BcrD ATPase family protein n=1 Tax=Litorisediminicola beolgyonensis TaxID=1173614 RepID=A0ABW3ZKR5_9RHOB
MDSAQTLIAVDAGGSTSRFVLVTGEGRIEHRGTGANVFTDFDAALEVLWDGIHALGSRARRKLSEVPAYLALAGVIDAEVGQRVARALPLMRCRVEEDWRASVVGALGSADGAVINIGTGSFLARQEGGRLQALGGHGLILGDEASGAWLGRSYLTRALHAAEGLGPMTPALDGLLAAKGGMSGIVGFASRARPSDFAEIAPQVVTAAQNGDAVAQALIEEGAAYLDRALGALGWRGHEPICLQGGLSEAYAEALSEPVRAALIPPRGSALDGAVTLAERFAEEAA